LLFAVDVTAIAVDSVVDAVVDCVCSEITLALALATFEARVVAAAS
jgi:hypothetical protein